MFEAVIFDFDGVITDSEMLHLYTFNDILAQYDVEITEEDYITEYLGLTDFDLFELLIDAGDLKIPKSEIAKLIKDKALAFRNLAKTQAPIIGGVEVFLQMLKNNHIPTAICSGACLSDINVILKAAGLDSFFQAIVAADHVQKGKPDPQGFLLALDKLNENNRSAIAAESCIVIEDSGWGLEAAVAAKMHTIAVTNSYSADELKLAQKIVTRLDELTVDDLRNLCR